MLKPLVEYLAKWFNSKNDVLKLKQIHQRQEFKLRYVAIVS